MLFIFSDVGEFAISIYLLLACFSMWADGGIGTSIFPGNRLWECSELDTLYGTGQMNMCGRNALEH